MARGGRPPLEHRSAYAERVGATATVIRVEPESAQLRAIAKHAAEERSVPAREVLVRLLLHLPRVARADATVETDVASSEGDRLARELAAAMGPYAAWHDPPAPG